MSENLFAYIITNYSDSRAGAITGTRSTNTVDNSATKDKLSISNGDAACFNFLDNSNTSKLVFRKYNYNSSLLPNDIVTAQGAWSSPTASQIWDGIKNLHAVATKGNYLYGTCYDNAKIAVINMTGSTPYEQVTDYSFPSTLAQRGHVYHGEGLAIDGNYLYVLFSDNIGTGYSATHDDGYVLQYKINTSTGLLTYQNKYVRVGKNPFTLELNNHKLYVCCLGGMQQAGSTNSASCISIVTVSSTSMTVQNAAIPSSVTKDFRDISITGSYAYIFTGYFNTTYSAFNGYIYRTTVSNLAASSPSAWTLLKSVSTSGYFWGIHAEGYQNKRFWFIKGNVIEVYGTANGSTLGTPSKQFNAAALTNSGYTDINAACFIVANSSKNEMDGKEDEELERGESSVGKTCFGAARLAREARELAERAKE